MYLGNGTKQMGKRNLFLYFKLADNNEAVYPIKALRALSCSTDGKLDFYFDTANYHPDTTTATTDVIRCSMTADKEVETMQAFANLVNDNWNKKMNKQVDYIMVGDEIASKYFNANITAVDSITRAVTP